MNDHELSIKRIKEVNKALGDLSHQFIFIGGATVGLYSTKKDTINTRPTKDIDILAETFSLADYEDLESALRVKGFANDNTSNVICRWVLSGIQPITVDIMSPNPKRFGFTNQWYKEGIENTIYYSLDDSTTIKIFNAIYFMATKLEAYMNRGTKNCLFDKDFEDIAYIIGNREGFIEELKNSSTKVKTFIITSVKELVNQDIEECIIAMGPDIGGQQGARATYQKMLTIASM